jgi:hypothetical protein
MRELPSAAVDLLSCDAGFSGFDPFTSAATALCWLTKPMPMQLTFCFKVLVNDRSRTHGQAP